MRASLLWRSVPCSKQLLILVAIYKKVWSITPELPQNIWRMFPSWCWTIISPKWELLIIVKKNSWYIASENNVQKPFIRLLSLNPIVRLAIVQFVWYPFIMVFYLVNIPQMDWIVENNCFDINIASSSFHYRLWLLALDFSFRATIFQSLFWLKFCFVCGDIVVSCSRRIASDRTRIP